MIRLLNRAIALLTAVLALAACAQGTSSEPETKSVCETDEPLPALGLMTSLPIYWPANFFSVDVKEPDLPWQRSVLEQCNRLVPLDTLSVNENGFGPLAELDRLAVIQPSGLSPADNVALDEWVRAGGHLLLVLDPMLTGEYELPLGDPGRPVDTALIPPVVQRWGLEVEFIVHEVWEDGIRSVELDGNAMTVMHGGAIAITDPAAAACVITADQTIARCAIGEGEVTLVADAALFEHREAAGESGSAVNRLLAFAFQ